MIFTGNRVRSCHDDRLLVGGGQKYACCCQDALVHLAEQIASCGQKCYAKSLAYILLVTSCQPSRVQWKQRSSRKCGERLRSVIVICAERRIRCYIMEGFRRWCHWPSKRLSWARRPTGLPHMMVCWASILSSDVLRSGTDWTRLWILFSQAIESSEQTEMILYGYIAYTVLMEVQLARGDLEAAHHLAAS